MIICTGPKKRAGTGLNRNPFIHSIHSKDDFMTDNEKIARQKEKIYRMTFASVYPLYIAKAEKKGRSRDEVETIISWLTGYDKKGLSEQIEKESDFEAFFTEAPRFNPDASKITGVICGYRVEEIEDEIVRKLRYLDKLIDELAKGKSLDKILRK